MATLYKLNSHSILNRPPIPGRIPFRCCTTTIRYIVKVLIEFEIDLFVSPVITFNDPFIDHNHFCGDGVGHGCRIQ